MSKLSEVVMRSNGLYTSGPLAVAPDSPTPILDDPDELLDTRNKINKLHSEGYFEQFFPEADAALKRAMHDRVSGRVAKRAEDEEKMGGNIIINITLPSR